MIPYDNFGGDGPLIHFTHANGYPPRTYTPFLSALTDSYRIWGMHQRPLWSATRPQDLSSWHPLADDLITFCDRHQLRHIVGMGHSLGAVATLFAAHRRPDLFRAIILIEPVFLSWYKPLVAGLLPDSVMARYPLVRVALNRRKHWPSREAAFKHLRDKSVFKRVADESLRAFVKHGLHETADGNVTLTYDREWEARIYRMPPFVWHILPQVKTPTLGIRGAHTHALSLGAWRWWQKLQPQAHRHEFETAGHLVPFEQPEALAACIKALALREFKGYPHIWW